MAFETLQIEHRGAAATITLNRPDALNALNQQLSGELRDALRALGGDPAVRAVCITGAGRAFSAGADLKDMAGLQRTPEGHPDVAGPMRDRYGPVISTIREMPKPVVAAVRGGAAGIGCSVALACDFVVADDSAYFLLAFIHISLAPDGGAVPFIAARAGAGRALEMAMLGERIPADRALDWGLINRVLPSAEFEAGAATLVDLLAAGPTAAYAATKHQLNQWIYRGLDDQLELEAVLQQQMASTSDFTEGVTAFLHKRAPSFRGA